MASAFYGNGLKGLCGGNIDLDTDTIKVALVTASYTPDKDVHDFFDDITNEVSGTGYTAGGLTITSPVLTVDATNHRMYFDADDAQWPVSTITAARYAIIYKSTGIASTSRLIAYVDLGGNKSTVADTFYIQWTAPASGGVAYVSY